MLKDKIDIFFNSSNFMHIRDILNIHRAMSTEEKEQKNKISLNPNYIDN